MSKWWRICRKDWCMHTLTLDLLMTSLANITTSQHNVPLLCMDFMVVLHEHKNVLVWLTLWRGQDKCSTIIHGFYDGFAWAKNVFPFYYHIRKVKVEWTKEMYPQLWLFTREVGKPLILFLFLFNLCIHTYITLHYNLQHMYMHVYI